MALRGTSDCQAVSRAQAAQVRCEAPQMPQARGVTISPDCGSLPRRMISRPRKSSAWVQALTTRPPSISTRTSRSPSTRPTGEMSRVFVVVASVSIGLPSDDEDVVFGPAGRGRLGRSRQLDVADLVEAGRQRLRHTHQGLRLEYGAWGEVVERELRLGAAE